MLRIVCTTISTSERGNRWRTSEWKSAIKWRETPEDTWDSDFHLRKKMYIRRESDNKIAIIAQSLVFRSREKRRKFFDWFQWVNCAVPHYQLQPLQSRRWLRDPDGRFCVACWGKILEGPDQRDLCCCCSRAAPAFSQRLWELLYSPLDILHAAPAVCWSRKRS